MKKLNIFVVVLSLIFGFVVEGNSQIIGENNSKLSSLINENEVKEIGSDLQAESIAKSFNYKGQYKVGNPYIVQGKTYYPKEYKSYDETGLASLYNDIFEGKPTASGEKYNSNELTAAHKTLPLPSIVKVTNSENGKTVIVKVNDRGPFSDDRIIDLSKQAATDLGLSNKGFTKVEVALLTKETENLQKALNLK